MSLIRLRRNSRGYRQKSQVDSDGNQDQATNQEELSPQDNDIISLQVLKDDFLPGLPTQIYPRTDSRTDTRANPSRAFQAFNT